MFPSAETTKNYNHQCKKYSAWRHGKKWYTTTIHNESHLVQKGDDKDASVGMAKDENMYNCPDCNKSYNVTNGQLKKHILIAHGRLSWVKFHCTKIPKIQEFYCKECTFYFRKEENI